MKILLLIDSLVRGGKERRMIELVKGLLTYPDVSLEIVTFKKDIEYKEIFNIDVPLHILERKPKKDPRVFYRLYKLVKKFQPDLIHSWGTMASIYALPTAKILGIKFINGNVADAPLNLSYKNTNYLRSQITFYFSDWILGNSQAGLDAYDAPEHKSQCIYNGFDFNRIKTLKAQVAIRKELNIKTPKVVGMVGAFFERKDFDTYIDAACKVLETRTDVSFLAIGNGPNLEECRTKVPSQYKDKIILPGLMSDVESVVNIFDIGVLCTNSKVHGEGISNSILEYMVLEKPVIATEGGGTNEIIVDGKTGWLVPFANVEILSNKINNLLNEPQKAQEMGENGKKRVEEYFSLDRMKKDYLDLYFNMLN